jgi:hypothetical protein
VPQARSERYGPKRRQGARPFGTSSNRARSASAMRHSFPERASSRLPLAERRIVRETFGGTARAKWLSSRSVRPALYGPGMPHWVVMLAAAVAAWLLLAVGGGFALGRSLDALARWLRRPRASGPGRS